MSNESSKMRLTSLFLTGYLDGLEKLRHKMDSVPYEKFPYCCTADNIVKQDLNLNRPIAIMDNNDKHPPINISTGSGAFWTPSLIHKYSNIKSAYSHNLIDIQLPSFQKSNSSVHISEKSL